MRVIAALLLYWVPKSVGANDDFWHFWSVEQHADGCIHWQGITSPIVFYNYLIFYYNYNHFTTHSTLSATNRYQKKHSPTHTYRGHQSSLISFLHLLRSKASSLLNLRACQSFSTISLSFLWSTSWPGTLHFILHTFLHPIIVFFSQHMPIPPQPVLL